MKKAFLALLVLSSVALVACGNKEEKKEDSSSQTKVSSSSTVAKQKKANSSTVSASSSEVSTETSTNSSSSSSDNTYYTGNYYAVQGKYSEVIIVNKKHPLSPSYNPGENSDAAAAFWQLVADMQARGFAVGQQYSGFRSYEYQGSLYNSYVASDGQANADRYSARAGYSEHQTGLAFDLMDTSGSLLQEPEAANWLAKNAHKYGFIVRYLPGKESITGYMAESWHVRYIGQEAAEIYESGLTLEEYYGVDGGDYVE